MKQILDNAKKLRAVFLRGFKNLNALNCAMDEWIKQRFLYSSANVNLLVKIEVAASMVAESMICPNTKHTIPSTNKRPTKSLFLRIFIINAPNI